MLGLSCRLHLCWHNRSRHRLLILCFSWHDWFHIFILGLSCWGDLSWRHLSWRHLYWSHIDWDDLGWGDLGWGDLGWGDLSWSYIGWSHLLNLCFSWLDWFNFLILGLSCWRLLGWGDLEGILLLIRNSFFNNYRF